ncbi:MAG: site-specific integrase [Candidatus Acidiferrales bacterium]
MSVATFKVGLEIERIWRENRCLTPASIKAYEYRVNDFINYCRGRNLLEKAQLTRAGVRVFARWYACAYKLDFEDVFDRMHAALSTWATARRTLGEELPPWVPVPNPLASLSPMLREFAEHLREHRGNPPGTIHKKAEHVKKLLAFLRVRRRHPYRARLTDIDAFLIKCRERYARATAADIGCSVRSFMRFMVVSGRMTVDLAPSIVGPVIRPAERPHRTLPWEDVQGILRAVDRSTRCGRRDYALLLMMSSYGLGAGEIIRLMLDDIDWQAATIRVHRPKTGVEFLLPLLPAVARALAAYLRHGRPIHAQTRNLFVTLRAPHGALACSVTVRHILHTHAQRAGVSAPFLGTHVLRHTHACRQLELGTQVKVIGDILGHRDPESTSAYLRVSVEGLRQMALPVPR